MSLAPLASVCAPGSVDIASITSDANNTNGTVSYWLDETATLALNSPSAITTSGTYYVKMDNNGCSDIAAVDVEIFASITEQSVISNLYPNPATELLVIEMTATGELLILDISGKIVQEQHLDEGKNGVEIGQLSTGTYIAKIKGRSKATIFHVQ